jgi:hypothetical protein
VGRTEIQRGDRKEDGTGADAGEDDGSDYYIAGIGEI